jgi:hypothetical protein
MFRLFLGSKINKSEVCCLILLIFPGMGTEHPISFRIMWCGTALYRGCLPCIHTYTLFAVIFTTKYILAPHVVAKASHERPHGKAHLWIHIPLQAPKRHQERPKRPQEAPRRHPRETQEAPGYPGGSTQEVLDTKSDTPFS